MLLLKTDVILKTLDEAISIIINYSDFTDMITYSTINGDRFSSDFFFITELINDKSKKNAQKSKIKNINPHDLINSLKYSDKGFKIGDYKQVLNSLYQNPENYVSSVILTYEFLFNISNWVKRNYIISDKMKYLINEKSKGKMVFSGKQGKKNDFILIFYVKDLVEGEIVFDPTIYDYVSGRKESDSHQHINVKLPSANLTSFQKNTEVIDSMKLNSVKMVCTACGEKALIGKKCPNCGFLDKIRPIKSKSKKKEKKIIPFISK